MTTEIHRLNYIGSKFQLIPWLELVIKEKTGWADFRGKRIGDFFAGTGIISHHFRSLGATTLTNDAELYSSIISEAFALSVFSPLCQQFIQWANAEIAKAAHTQSEGYIFKNYSPSPGCERMFFTLENAKRIDYIRGEIEKIYCNPAEYKFLVASLLLSADAVSNVPAVYGCYLKKFKAKAEKPLVLKPIHNNTIVPLATSKAYHSDVLTPTFLSDAIADAVYLDPPYNERQYSKNYFPLNMIAKTPEELLKEPALTGKTGIPQACFISPFCKKTEVRSAFKKVIKGIKAQWVFLSYSSESLIKKDDMVALLKEFGEVSVSERDYKRFKSFEYNEDKKILEYLFCLKKSVPPSAEVKNS